MPAEFEFYGRNAVCSGNVPNCLNTRILAFVSVLLAAPLAVSQQQSVVPQYTITTVAGNQGDGSGYSGDGDSATAAQLSSPTGIAVDSSGNIYIADQNNNVIRQVTGGAATILAGNGTINTIAGNQSSSGYLGDGASAIGSNAEFKTPVNVALDSSNNVYVVDLGNDVIRKFPMSSSGPGNLSTVAGNNTLYIDGPNGVASGGFSGDNALATNALLNLPYAIALDSSGNMYIADTINNRIREVTVSNGNIKTIVGNGTQGAPGSNTDVGSALSVHLFYPHGVAVGPNGVIYIADTNDHRVLKVSGGAVTVVAGTGTPGFSGDGGPAARAQLQYPRSVAVDSLGNVYIADYTNHAIRFVSAVTGDIYTITGAFCGSSGCTSGYSGDGGSSTGAQLNFPSAVIVDSNFNVYVADTQNNVIRELVPAGPPANVSGTPSIRSTSGVISASGFGCQPSNPGCGSDGVFHSTAQGSWIEIYGTNLAPAGDTRSWTSLDFTTLNGVTTAATVLDLTTVSIGNQAAFVSYISPTQINALVPSNVGLGPQPVVVSTGAGVSNSFTINVGLTQPALLALPQWNVGGNPYVTATFTDGVTYVGPVGAFPGVTSRPAKPGETIVLYGIGFGPVTGNIPAGQVVQQLNSLLNPIQFSFGGTVAATPSYYGLAPSETGLYQFNVTVPTNATPGNAVPLTFTLGSVAGAQTLYTAIQN